MVHVTSGIRWTIGAWCVLAIVLVGWSIAVGARPASTVMLLVVGAAPLGVVASLVGFAREPLTAAEVLHGDEGTRGVR